ncbi:hypothetical protein FNV43_RR13552 [Rhamnella rubrinervis]|uniref:Serine/arginine repetitive matrix protein 1-like n=1 Tax=Rhamnella rubrinervis TaxID=2594499 RepID=A0A8K0H1C7_9ROSA|nr:hypothetical protein FNV43_RR13552 [Rhamnella rubrinervis]
MGCCLSTTKTSQRDPVHPEDQNHHHHFHARSLVPEPEPTHAEKTLIRDPPSAAPVVEEESVKEVLSETPIWRPQQEPNKTMLEKKTHLPATVLQVEAKELSEASQISENCGISESFSLSTTTTTTTITEVRDEDEAISKRKREVGSRARLNGSQASMRRKRPNSGDLSRRRERGPIAPGNRYEASSEKRNRVESGSVRGREAGQMRTMQRTVGSAGARRDVGEVSSRRSRSPATRTVRGVNRGGMVRNPSKATGLAGGRSVGVESGGTKEDLNDSVLQVGNESLENPLVSLECFIFL